jgi:hypothetical protein
VRSLWDYVTSSLTRHRWLNETGDAFHRLPFEAALVQVASSASGSSDISRDSRHVLILSLSLHLGGAVRFSARGRIEREAKARGKDTEGGMS